MYKLILKNERTVTYRYLGSFFNRMIKEYGITYAVNWIKEQ